MKTFLLFALSYAIPGVDAFVPQASVQPSIILNAATPPNADSKWYFEAWSGIKQEDFFPRPRAYFTPPAEALADVKQSAAASLPQAAVQSPQPMPDISEAKASATMEK